ncbi:MAG: hypothetical protein OXD32_05915, partial [Endozoicomonadaceae bacterium]|nr:hypothetical protein [Endozoicomonadaceae bacterium]
MLAVPAATELVPQKYFNSLIRVPEGTKNIFLLEQSECYPALLQQFTKNVKDFSIFTKLFLNDKAVGEQVNDFLNKISDSKAVDREDQFMLFTDVHPMLHALVNTLKELNCLCPKEIRDKVVAALDNIASTPDEVVSEPAETVSASKQINPECIINILSNSSEGMNLCYEGIKSRLSEALMATTHMITGTENFDVIKQSAKYNVLKQYITLFLARHKIKQRIDFGLYHIHWFNFLYRQICGNYGLPSHPDNFAVRPSNMSDAMLNEFFSQYPLFINESAFLDAITEHFSFKLQEILAKHGKSHWLTDASIQAEEMTLDVITDITNKFFQSCEQLNKGDAWYIFDEKPDGTYTAARHHEKIKALLALEENKDQIKRLDVIQDKEDTKQYIGTKNGIFFWVFNQEDSKVEPLEEVEKCNLLDEGYIPLQLSHLASLNTEKLSADELNTLIIQALNQTNEAKAISTFFLELNGMDLLAKLPLIITVELSELLQNKMDKNPVFKSELCKLLNAHLAGPEIEIPTTETITLLELYLYKMHKDNNGNIAKITKDLDILQIKNFSKASLQKLFNQEDCK